MPNLKPNSTNYTHSFEPNTNDFTMATASNKDGWASLGWIEVR